MTGLTIAITLFGDLRGLVIEARSRRATAMIHLPLPRRVNPAARCFWIGDTNRRSAGQRLASAPGCRGVMGETSGNALAVDIRARSGQRSVCWWDFTHSAVPFAAASLVVARLDVWQRYSAL